MNFKKTLAELVLPLFLNCAIPETYLQTPPPTFDPKAVNWKKVYVDSQETPAPEALEAYNQLISDLAGKAVLKTTRIEFINKWEMPFVCLTQADSCYIPLVQKIYFSRDVPLFLVHEQGHFLDQNLNVFSDHWLNELEAYAFISYFIDSFHKEIDRETGKIFFNNFFYSKKTFLRNPLENLEEQIERTNALREAESLSELQKEKNNFERFKAATKLYLQKEKETIEKTNKEFEQKGTDQRMIGTTMDLKHSLGYDALLILLVSDEFNFDSKKVYGFVSTARKEKIVEKLDKTLEGYSFADLNKRLKGYLSKFVYLITPENTLIEEPLDLSILAFDKFLEETRHSQPYKEIKYHPFLQKDYEKLEKENLDKLLSSIERSPWEFELHENRIMGRNQDLFFSADYDFSRWELLFRERNGQRFDLDVAETKILGEEHAWFNLYPNFPYEKAPNYKIEIIHDYGSKGQLKFISRIDLHFTVKSPDGNRNSAGLTLKEDNTEKTFKEVIRRYQPVAEKLRSKLEKSKLLPSSYFQKINPRSRIRIPQTSQSL